MTAAIVAQELTRWYGPRLAVDRVSFDVAAGEVMGLLGPNGSGKTTILRILTGYLRPSGGTARIAGVDVLDAPLEARRHVGYVPEDVPLYDWMRVREFLEFMAGIKRVPPPVRPALDDVVERIALGGVTELTIGKLSRGYRQRVAIAQALLNAPAVLILDEPTNGLDPRQIIEMRRLIRSLAGRHTVLVSSHVLGEIEKVADRAAILLGGRLLAIHALGERGAGHRLRVRVRGAAAVVCACLEGVTGVNRLTLEGEPADGIVTGVVEVDGAAVAEAVAAAVSAHGLGLAEVTEHRADLESVFLALTAGGPTTM